MVWRKALFGSGAFRVILLDARVELAEVQEFATRSHGHFEMEHIIRASPAAS